MKIRDLIDKIPDRETLIFCLWMFKKIANNEELPSPEKLKALRAAFIRMIKALRERKKIRQEDLALVLQYTDTSGLDIARPLGATVRHLRETQRLTRRTVSRLSGFPTRWLTALERGQIHDLSIPELARLSKGLGLGTVGLMKELEKKLNLSSNTD
jgi:transcriptional regulator with XRE-family HTH domain